MVWRFKLGGHDQGLTYILHCCNSEQQSCFVGVLYKGFDSSILGPTWGPILGLGVRV